jgi:predicted O-methyltransferase YrrM
MGHKAKYDLYELLREIKGPKRMVEVGVLAGETSQYLLDRIPDLYLTMVDPWIEHSPDSSYARSGDGNSVWKREEWDRIYLVAYERTRVHRHRCEVIRATSFMSLHLVDDSSVDLVFIDADHSYEAVRSDILGWYWKVKPGGILCGHDYAHRFSWSGVVRAVDEWIAKTGLTLNHKGQSVWWVRKPEEN